MRELESLGVKKKISGGLWEKRSSKAFFWCLCNKFIWLESQTSVKFQ